MPFCGKPQGISFSVMFRKASRLKALLRRARQEARISMTSGAFPLRCWKRLQPRCSSLVCGKGIEPEGSSYKELAMTVAGFDRSGRIAASVLEAASAAMLFCGKPGGISFSVMFRKASRLKALLRRARQVARISMTGGAFPLRCWKRLQPRCFSAI
jgi:hypothetical protein